MFFSLSIGRKDPTHASGNQTRGGGGLHGSHTFAIPNPFKDRHLPLTGAKQKKRWKIKTAKKDTPRLSSPHWHHQRVQKSQEQRPGCDVGGRALVSDRTLLAWGCQVQFPQPLPPSPTAKSKNKSKGILVGIFGGCISPFRRFRITEAWQLYFRRRQPPTVRPSTPD